MTESKDSLGSQSGICTVGKAKMAIGGWTYYRAAIFDQYGNPRDKKEVQQSLATKALLESQNCAKAKGKVKTFFERFSPRYWTMCEFSDGSSIETRALQLGAKATENQELLALISK